MHLNHKAILTSLIAALTIGLLSSCRGNSTNKPTAETIQTEDSNSNNSENTTPQATSNSDIDPKNIEKQMLKLVDYDHGFNPREVMTPELRALYEEAYCLPNEAFGDIGNHENLAYALNPYQDYDTIKVVCDAIQMKGEDEAEADMIMTIFGNELRNKFFLKQCNGEWLIDDYTTAQNESYRAVLTEFIASQRQYFLSEEWTKSVEEKMKEENSEEIVEKTLQEVKDYFQKYPEQ
jgi:hypothetical protein